MRIALLQMAPVPGGVSDNLASIERSAAEAAHRGVELLIAPELATTGYGAGEVLRDLAEPRDATQIAGLSAIAKTHGLALIAGFPEREGSCIYNSVAFTDGHTDPVVYRKSYLYGDYERALFTPGDPTATAIAQWCGIRIGLLICFDVEFPENVRRLALNGADLVAAPAALLAGPDAGFVSEHIIRVRAFENQLFVAYANQTGCDDLFTYAGLSHITGPNGGTLAKASANEAGIIFAEICPQDYAASRAANPYLSELRARAKSAF
jgi:5-aminopentanamidase